MQDFPEEEEEDDHGWGEDELGYASDYDGDDEEDYLDIDGYPDDEDEWDDDESDEPEEESLQEEGGMPEKKAADSEEEDEEKEKSPVRIKIEQDMDDFRQLLEDYRDSHFYKDKFYRSIENDESYAILRHEGELSKHEDIIKRFYPPAKDIFKKRPPVVRDPENDPMKYKLAKAEVYIKEFKEDPEVVRAQIQQMKLGNAQSGELSQRIGSNIKELQSEIPLIQKDLERYIGENLLNKIAFLIILAAVAVLYQYGITKGYINETYRVIVGFGLGAAFITLAHLILTTVQRTRTLFMGIGAATIMYTISLSFYDYDVLSKTQAFAGNVVISLILIFYTIKFERKDIALLAYIAAFVSPFLVSTGEKNPVFFFSYLLVVDIIFLMLAYRKEWHIIMAIPLAATLIAFQVYLITTEFTLGVEYTSALCFDTIFYAIFFMSVVAYNLKPTVEYKSVDYFLLMAITVLYLINILNLLSVDYRPAFIAGLGIFQLYYALMLYGSEKMGKGVQRQLMAFSMIMITLAIWMEFSALYVNIWWAVEGVILAWLGIRMGSNSLRNGSAVVTTLSLLTMFYNWSQTYFASKTLPLVFNSGFASGLVTVLSLSAIITLFYSDKKEYDVIAITKVYYAKTLSSFLMFISYFMGVFELLWHAPNLVGGSEYRTILIDAYTMLFMLLMRYMVYKLDIRRLQESVGWLMGLSVIFYIIFGHRAALVLRSGFLNDTLPFYPFGTHYLNVIISVFLNYILIKDIVSSESYASGKYSFALWFLCIVVICHMSYELEHNIVLIRSAWSEIPSIADFLYQVRLTGFSILWSLLSFIFMYIGLRYKLKELRMISLVLFAITILKFFAFDFRKLAPMGQIISLVVIGLLLLAVSQLYNKLRKLLALEGPLFDRDHNYSQDETAAIIKAHKDLKRKQQEGE